MNRNLHTKSGRKKYYWATKIYGNILKVGLSPDLVCSWHLKDIKDPLQIHIWDLELQGEGK